MNVNVNLRKKLFEVINYLGDSFYSFIANYILLGIAVSFYLWSYECKKELFIFWGYIGIASISILIYNTIGLYFYYSKKDKIYKLILFTFVIFNILLFLAVIHYNPILELPFFLICIFLLQSYIFYSIIFSNFCIYPYAKDISQFPVKLVAFELAIPIIVFAISLFAFLDFSVFIKVIILLIVITILHFSYQIYKHFI